MCMHLLLLCTINWKVIIMTQTVRRTWSRFDGFLCMLNSHDDVMMILTLCQSLFTSTARKHAGIQPYFLVEVNTGDKIYASMKLNIHWNCWWVWTVMVTSVRGDWCWNGYKLVTVDRFKFTDKLTTYLRLWL